MTAETSPARPNILMIVVDQYRYPPPHYGDKYGFHEPLNNILGFRGTVSSDSQYAEYFPGLRRLRQNAKVLRNHIIASSACTPSRAAMFTGQYSSHTGVTQTDGMFKDGTDPHFPWLKADGAPTLGDWLRGAGYTTHYFGKWHVSHPPDNSLEDYGFANWELSYPEPHGAATNNLGLFRDPGFTDNACLFLRRRGLAQPHIGEVLAPPATPESGPAGPAAPWFAVLSFTNPHDIATYPMVIAQALPAETDDSRGPSQPVFGPLTIPSAGTVSFPPISGTARIPLNPLGFPQDCGKSAPSQDENLANKPSCHVEAAYKIGLALAAKASHGVVSAASQLPPGQSPKDSQTDAAVALARKFSIPFQLSEDPAGNGEKFLQFYGWLHAQVDHHINRVLQTLEETGLAENTVVIFTADHGEMGAAHGLMLQKWHVAYEEAIHVPLVVRFPPSPSAPQEAEPQTGEESITSIGTVTSHIDLIPTVLGLAGVSAAERDTIAGTLAATHDVFDLPGIDLSPLLRGDTTTIDRAGVLFITDDELTEPMKGDRSSDYYQTYQVFAATVDAVKTDGATPDAAQLAAGGVRQPNHLRAVRTDTFKLARYFNGKDPTNDNQWQWEMYDLTPEHDPNEKINLLRVNGPQPAAIDTAQQPDWARTYDVQAKANQLYVLLQQLEAEALTRTGATPA